MSGKRPRSGAWAQEPQASSSAPPQTTERYACIERLAVGGMGVVWRARDNQLNRDVAYKSVVMGASEDAHVRLVQEARLAAQLGLTGVVQVFDHGTDRDGRPYYTMELLDFPLFTGELSADLHALASVAATVGEAHAEGLVHRDLKPSNLGRRGTDAVVADWGLARPFAAMEHWDRSVLSNQRAQTRTGVGLGTAGYMAPEQLTGEGSDPRADVWSLAAVLHELLTGEPPYNPDGTHRLLNAVVGGRLEVPDGPLGAIARKGLSLDPELRHPNGTAFAEALKAALAPPAPPPSRLPWLLAAGGLIAATLAMFSLQPSPSADLERLAADAIAEQGWLLHGAGRLKEARQRALEAAELRLTPRVNGLLAVPIGGAVTPLAPAPECDRIVLDRASDGFLCLSNGSLSLQSLAGEVRWQRDVSEPTALRLEGGIATLRDGWQLYAVAPDGTTSTDVNGRLTAEVTVHGKALLKRLGPEVWIGDEAMVDDIAWLGPNTEHGQLMHRRDDGLVRLNLDNTTTVGPDLPDPLAGWGRWNDTLTLVSLRGTVLELDPETLELTDSYRLQGASQVFDASVAQDGTIAASTNHGVMLFDRQTPSAQITTSPVDQVVYHQNGRLVLEKNGELSTYFPDPSATSVAWSRMKSITALIMRNTDQIGVGTGNGIGMVNPTTLQGTYAPIEGHGPFRSLAVTTTSVFHGAPGGNWNNKTKQWEPGLHMAASVGSDTLVLSHQVISGLTWRSNGQDIPQHDTPNFVQLVTGEPQDHALGRDNTGKVWKITADRQILPVDVAPVTLLEASRKGLWVARGSEVSLEGRFTTDLGDRVTTLVAGESYLSAGTMGGEVWVWTLDGEPLAQMSAHGERVSALEFAGHTLLTGSWQPGLRRWLLEDLETPAP